MTEPSQPSFSIIIPAFNAERFLRDTLLSVQRQTFRDFECIVVDDGSTDNTRTIGEAFQADRRFRSISIPHGGSPGRARNHGIRETTGPYVAFLDADDLWTCEKLWRCYSRLEATGAAMVFHNGYAIDEYGRRTSLLLSRHMKPRLVPRDPLLVLTNVVSMSSVVVKRELVGDRPFSEDTDIRGAEEYLLWLQVNGDYPIEYVNEPLELYRSHEGQIHRGYAEQLRKSAKILRDPTVVELHSAETLALGQTLIELKSGYAKRELWTALSAACSLARWLGTPQRVPLLAYIRFGLVHRATIMLRQRLMGSLVGI